MDDGIDLFPEDPQAAAALLAAHGPDWTMLQRSGCDEADRRYRRVFKDVGHGIYYTLGLQRPLNCLPHDPADQSVYEEIRHADVEKNAAREMACYRRAANFGFDVGAHFSQVTLPDPVTFDYCKGGEKLDNGNVVSLLAVREIGGRSIDTIMADKSVGDEAWSHILHGWAGEVMVLGYLTENYDAANCENSRVVNADIGHLHYGHFDLEYAGSGLWDRASWRVMEGVESVYSAAKNKRKNSPSFKTAAFCPLFEETRDSLAARLSQASPTEVGACRTRMSKGLETLNCRNRAF